MVCWNVGEDPMAVLRWSLVRVFFRACFAFVDAGRQHRRISAGNCMITVRQFCFFEHLAVYDLA